MNVGMNVGMDVEIKDDKKDNKDTFEENKYIRKRYNPHLINLRTFKNENGENYFDPKIIRSSGIKYLIEKIDDYDSIKDMNIYMKEKDQLMDMFRQDLKETNNIQINKIVTFSGVWSFIFLNFLNLYGKVKMFLQLNTLQKNIYKNDLYKILEILQNIDNTCFIKLLLQFKENIKKPYPLVFDINVDKSLDLFDNDRDKFVKDFNDLMCFGVTIMLKIFLVLIIRYLKKNNQYDNGLIMIDTVKIGIFDIIQLYNGFYIKKNDFKDLDMNNFNSLVEKLTF